MFHAAALFAGLFGLCLALAPAWRGAETIAVAGAASLIAVLWISRLGGADSESAPLWRFVRLAPLLASRVRASLRGAASVGRMALAADVTLKPALVKLRARTESDAGRAAFAHLVSATPGAVVVDADSDGLLIHVLQEDAIDARDLSLLESHVMRALEGGAA